MGIAFSDENNTVISITPGGVAHGDVKLVLGLFGALFGTQAGSELREWCEASARPARGPQGRRNMAQVHIQC